MRREWDKVTTELKIWRYAALPGIIVLILVILARVSGSLQVLEWMLLDTFLRLRPPEPVDEHVVIVGIDEYDIAKAGGYPIPDGKIADLLNKLETYKPRAIGLDLFKNVPVEPGHNQLVKTFQDNPNIFGIEKNQKPKIPAPNFMTQERTGIVDIHSDNDGKNRRYILWTPNSNNFQEDRFSLGFKLAQFYLTSKGINDEDGEKDQDTIRFGNTELPRVIPNFGGYVDKEITGELQILINFRHRNQPFRVFSLNDIKTGQTQEGKIDPNWLRDKIIIVGNLSPSVGDNLYTLAIPGRKITGQIYGVEYHAHATSQIVNAVLNNRPMLKSWSELWEYIWIIILGIIPIAIGRFTQSITKNLLGVTVVGLGVAGSGYISLLLWGVWVPVVPNLLILAMNGVGLSAFAFFQHDKLLREKNDQQKRTIEYTFNLIHNGPLQTLANGLQQLRKQNLPNEQLIYQFEKLNSEIREIGEYLRVEALTNHDSLRLGSGLKIDLNRQIHDLFYEVYSSTLERNDLEYLKTLKIKTRTFEPINDKYLSMELKRELCLFLEESLCNVGKHARGVKCIEASGTCVDGEYSLCIKDDGSGLTALSENKGTKQSQNLARKLNGRFKRETVKPRGTVCELIWKLNTNFQQINFQKPDFKSRLLKSFHVP
ncbi:CHASE2 domain-containing protein [Nostoc sp. MG11]|uniref:sensor histidine kinase n=1 Tax=Nostoc sp. MG11 TaxID=2721166 RepID=UPI0018687DB3|nr:CHASE2 domain-containing protein [Nostoc sp. MG11]